MILTPIDGEEQPLSIIPYLLYVRHNVHLQT